MKVRMQPWAKEPLSSRHDVVNLLGKGEGRRKQSALTVHTVLPDIKSNAGVQTRTPCYPLSPALCPQCR